MHDARSRINAIDRCDAPVRALWNLRVLWNQFRYKLASDIAPSAMHDDGFTLKNLILGTHSQGDERKREKISFLRNPVKGKAQVYI